MNKFNLSDLDVNEINTLIAGLLELPAKASMGLYGKIKTQVEAQMASQQNGAGDTELPWKDKN